MKYDISQLTDAGGWIAAGGILVAAAWRSFAAGARIGRLEQKVDTHGEDLKYIRRRLDEYIVNQSKH